MPSTYPPRRGFTVVEVVVAIFLFTLALGALEWTAAITVRRLRENSQEGTAVRLVQGRVERVLASPCVGSRGIDSSEGVIATWSTTTDGNTIWIDQESRYSTRFGERREIYRTAGRCR